MTGITANPDSSSAARMTKGVREVLSSASVVCENEPLARRTTLRVGGCADVWVEPADERDLSAVLSFASEHSVPVMVFGRGSNLLVRDGGLRGIVICLSQPYFLRVEAQGDRLRCGAGVRLHTVASEARKNGLTGLEFFEGIPGTLGGALRMNAGAHGGSSFDIVTEVRLLDLRGELHVMAGSEISSSYRSCPMLQTHVAVQAVLRGQPEDRDAIGRRMRELSQRRWSSQPTAPSAGCMFKNPESIPAGKLVDELGLKGTRVGGAMVSHEHGNFIVTGSNTKSGDVLRLIELIKEQARTRRGIELETEVQIVGEEVRV